MMSVTYETPILKTLDDPKVKGVTDFVAELGRAALPGAHFVEFFPWLIHVPPMWVWSVIKVYTVTHIENVETGSQSGNEKRRNVTQEHRECTKTSSIV